MSEQLSQKSDSCSSTDWVVQTNFGDGLAGLSSGEQLLRLEHNLNLEGNQFAFFIVVLPFDSDSRDRLNGWLFWSRLTWQQFCSTMNTNADYIVYCLAIQTQEEFDFALGLLTDKSLHRSFIENCGEDDIEMKKKFALWSRRSGRLYAQFNELRSHSTGETAAFSRTMRTSKTARRIRTTSYEIGGLARTSDESKLSVVVKKNSDHAVKTPSKGKGCIIQ